MTEGSEGKELRDAILIAFDRWGQRSLEGLLETLGNETPEAGDVVRRQARLLDLFLSKRALVPGFLRYVTGQLRLSSSYRRQRHKLLEAILGTITSPGGVEMRELVEWSSRQSEEAHSLGDQPTQGYTRRHIQRLFHERYGETLFEISGQDRTGLPDDRVALFSSVFAPTELPAMEATEEASTFLAVDRLTIAASNDLMTRIVWNATLRLICPDFLEDLLEFRSQCKVALSATREGRSVDLSRWGLLAGELKGWSTLFLALYSHITSIVAVAWWRSRREGGKKKLLERAFPLRYTPEDAKRARTLLNRLTGSKDEVLLILHVGALTLINYNMMGGAIAVFREALAYEDLSPMLRGILHENIGVVYRESGRPWLMLRSMKKAAGYYKRTGNLYRLCVALKNVAEAQWMLGHSRAVDRSMRELESRASDLSTDSEKFGVLWNLANSYRRLGEYSREYEQLMKCLDVGLPEEEEGKKLMVQERLIELNFFGLQDA